MSLYNVECVLHYRIMFYIAKDATMQAIRKDDGEVLLYVSTSLIKNTSL